MEEELMYCLMGHQMRSTLPPYDDKCDACTQSFFESDKLESTGPHYSCSECNITTHGKCAKLPKQIDHDMHPQHPLFLITKPPYELGACQCQVCKKDWSNFVYHCSSCEFDIDVVCAFLEQDMLISAHHHPVRLITRSSSFICNACDAQSEDDKSYMCIKPSCGFWVHKKCGSSPDMFIHPDHNHPLLLAISMPARYRRYKFICEICEQRFRSNAWVYYCQRCKYFIHIRCKENRSPEKWDSAYSNPPILAMIREIKTITEHILPSNRLEEVSMQQDKRLPELKVDWHKHSLLVISEDDDDDDENEVICDGCIVRIDHATCPYYKCGQNCKFFLHTLCANFPEHQEIPYEHRHHFPDDEFMLKLYFPENPWEVFKCIACNSFCNGYGYRCTGGACDFILDVKCFYMLGYIKHAGHKHLLYSGRIWKNYSDIAFTCNSCGRDLVRGNCSFMCKRYCYFKIGYECATLPPTVTHRWDKHPLILTFPPFFRDDPNADEEFYCEVCEEEIHPKLWIYRCAECDQSFHPRCIPTLGESRNIKFGNTFSIQSHPHPLTVRGSTS